MAAAFAAIRRASSLVSIFAVDRSGELMAFHGTLEHFFGLFDQYFDGDLRYFWAREAVALSRLKSGAATPRQRRPDSGRLLLCYRSQHAMPGKCGLRTEETTMAGFLLRASILIAAGWVWLNYSTGWKFHSVTHVAAQAGIIVLTGIALLLLAAGKKV
jgi:hypothetical protein